ncbi:hypothetical protein BB558_000731 [Smittium angustum]|uniref:dolichyl-phosphate beta-glucosyltransferase n=1 Tax=Smittium angustum TaxID=133377 RepID=A0A2U1JDP8_SMIAN|nr:hypothetical protein BB558_002114 [Smittium angustum]PWA03093.1 hypothetical protein BB558_000731 [Smittium angustum]
MNDGSTDRTKEVALSFGKEHNLPIKVVTHVINRGKGGSVTQGVLSSSGEYILFCDADGATKFGDIDELLKASRLNGKNGLSISVGSRVANSESDKKVSRSSIRHFLQLAFHTYVYILGVRGIKDTQCGFKMFSRKAAQIIFSQMHVERFIFDIEVLLLASYYKMPISEIPVNWHEVEGSKMSIVRDSIQMALDLLAVRLNYLLGLWKIKTIDEILAARKN